MHPAAAVAEFALRALPLASHSGAATALAAAAATPNLLLLLLHFVAGLF
jgi:hypothetical protein